MNQWLTNVISSFKTKEQSNLINLRELLVKKIKRLGLLSILSFLAGILSITTSQQFLGQSLESNALDGLEQVRSSLDLDKELFSLLIKAVFVIGLVEIILSIIGLIFIGYLIFTLGKMERKTMNVLNNIGG